MDHIHSYAEDVVRFYSKTVKFYPHKSLKIIHGDSDCDGGYPVKKGVIAIHGLQKFIQKNESWWRWIVAHEIAHMYFGYYVLEKHREPGSKLGWLTKGLGLYLDSLYMKESVNDTKYHQEYIELYLKAQKYGKNTSFSLTPDQIESLDFDYNEVVMHGRSYYVISEIEKIVGAKKFKELMIMLLEDFKHRKIEFDDLIKYIQKNFSPQFSYEVDKEK